MGEANTEERELKDGAKQVLTSLEFLDPALPEAVCPPPPPDPQLPEARIPTLDFPCLSQ